MESSDIVLLGFGSMGLLCFTLFLCVCKLAEVIEYGIDVWRATWEEPEPEEEEEEF